MSPVPKLFHDVAENEDGADVGVFSGVFLRILVKIGLIVLEKNLAFVEGLVENFDFDCIKFLFLII